ncbi:MAG: beta-N-acetylhexosaminidase [Chloroflexi bacterium]|nr:beta-N-acetylhexosaminidase [Chloroflexota bacterium]
MSQTLADLVGQSLMLRFAGTEPTPELFETLARIRPVGVVLFADNIRTPAGVHTLVGALQAEAGRLGLPPLLVAVDQEGGVVGRLPLPFATAPSQMALAATGDPDAAYQCARLTGRQLRAVAINTNFAPVLDVNSRPANPVIGTRSFGEDPAVVTQLALAALRGYQDTGIIATAKHFPGHGATDVDSHLDLPVVHDARERLAARDLVPFAAAIEAGLPALMTAHVLFPALDRHPATLSHAILTDLLRHDLGFEGIVFADSLQMRAIADRYPPAAAARLARAAGVDVLLPLGTLAEQRAVAGSLVEAVQSGELSRESFQATARRLDRLRTDYHLTHALPAFAEPDQAPGAAALALARRSMTVLHDRAALPLSSETSLVLIECLSPRWSPIADGMESYRRGSLPFNPFPESVGADSLTDPLVTDGSAAPRIADRRPPTADCRPATPLAHLLAASFPRTTALAIGPEPTHDEIARALALARPRQAVLLVTRNAFLIESQARLATAIAGLGLPVIHAAVHSPYDAAVVPGTSATILTYGDPPVSLQALVDVLAGRCMAQGAVPVRLSSRRSAVGGQQSAVSSRRSVIDRHRNGAESDG